MDKKTTRLWIDVTDLYNWTGGFTGIQNVVDNFTQLYIADGSRDIHFFYFDPAQQSFSELSIPDWQAKRQNILNYVEPEVSHEDIKPPMAFRVRRKGIAVAKRVTPSFAKKIARNQVDSYRQQKHGSKAERQHPFATGDAVLIIGGNWGDDFIGFAEGLVKIKQKTAIKLLHVVHDFIPMRYPNYFAPSNSYDRYFSSIAKAADGFLVVSKSTARDLSDYLTSLGQSKAAQPPIDVFRLGEDFPEVTPEKPDLALDDDFILCVGTIEGRKNHTLLYYTVKLALEKGIQIPQIIIAGRKGWMADATLRNLTVDPDLKGKVIVSHTITDGQKAWLFKNSLFTVYPSIYEGWGLPVAESLHNGKFCICSDSSSLPEVGEDYVGYCSPFDPKQLLDEITANMDKKTLAKREAYIKTRPAFTWQDSFTEFAQDVDKLVA